MEFCERIKEICNNYDRVALFVDMDGTVVEYNIFQDGTVTTESKGLFVDNRPVMPIINKLEEINKIENIDIYILTLSRSKIIEKEKEIWLKKHMPFVKEENYIILIRENGDYNSENRNYVKVNKMKEKEDKYDYLVLLDDDHNILRTTKREMGNKGDAFHISTALI